MNDRIPMWGFEASPFKTTTFAGGIPFLREHEPWPTDDEGNRLNFLFQIDLASVSPDYVSSLNLPKSGFLQFFHSNDDLYGMDLDDLEKPRSRTLVRFSNDLVGFRNKEFEAFVNEENYKANSPLKTPNERVYYNGEMSYQVPFENTIEAGTDFQTTIDAETDFQNEDDEEAPKEENNEYEFYLGGYPAFTQFDFRSHSSDFTLLLGSFSGSNIMWGDMGIAGFWATDEILSTQDYSDCFLYWDCY